MRLTRHWWPVQVVVVAQGREVLPRLELDERRKQDLLRKLQRNISVLSLPAREDANVADDEGLARARFNELFLARYFASNRGR